MKKCKKILVLALIVLLSMTLNVYADNSSAEVTLTPSATSVKVGETVTILLSARYENGIECVDSILEYDDTKLKLENVEMKNYFSDQSGMDAVTGEYVLTALYGEVGAPDEAPTEVEYAELTFTVLDSANVGDTLSVKLLQIDIIDPNLETASAGEEEVTLTVIEEPKPEEQEPSTPNPDEPKEDEPKEDETKQDEQKPTDNTTADKEINYAGIEEYAIILIIVVAAIAIIFYMKYRKYNSIY